MKKNLILKIVLATFTCFAVSFLISKSSGINSEEPYPISLFKRYMPELGCHPEAPAGKSNVFVKKFDSKDLMEIDLGLLSTNIELQPSASNEIELSYSGERALDLSDQIDGKILRLSEHASGHSEINFNCWSVSDHGLHFSFDTTGGKKITLRIPKQMKIFKLRATSSDISARDLSFDDLKIETVSGDLHLEHLQVKDFGLRTVSGDVVVSGDWGQANFKSVSGDLKIETLNASPRLGIQTTSGDVHLSLAKAVNAQVGVTSTSGDLLITGEKPMDSDVLRSGISKRLGTGTGEIALRSISGDLMIEFK